MSELTLIEPDWPTPATVRACCTTRSGGISQPPYDSLNLGDHVDDDPASVAANRRKLAQALALPGEPQWLSQVHGVEVATAPEQAGAAIEADAICSDQPGRVCAVLTADCLPALFCSRDGQAVAAAHAGWRGLAAGVLEATLAKLPVAAADVMVWLGPAIGPSAFQVGDEVYQAFVAQTDEDRAAFHPDGERWLADIYQLARNRLQRAGVSEIYGGDHCTFSDTERFYSYRRDGRTGRQASLIWRVA